MMTVYIVLKQKPKYSVSGSVQWLLITVKRQVSIIAFVYTICGITVSMV